MVRDFRPMRFKSMIEVSYDKKIIPRGKKNESNITNLEIIKEKIPDKKLIEAALSALGVLKTRMGPLNVESDSNKIKEKDSLMNQYVQEIKLEELAGYDILLKRLEFNPASVGTRTKQISFESYPSESGIPELSRSVQGYFWECYAVYRESTGLITKALRGQSSITCRNELYVDICLAGDKEDLKNLAADLTDAMGGAKYKREEPFDKMFKGFSSF